MLFRHGVYAKVDAEVIIVNKEYSVLFNAVTDALNALERVKELLVSAQQEAEELVIKGED